MDETGVVSPVLGETAATGGIRLAVMRHRLGGMRADGRMGRRCLPQRNKNQQQRQHEP